MYHQYCNIHPIYLFALLSLSKFSEDGPKKWPRLLGQTDVYVNPRLTTSKLGELRQCVLKELGGHGFQGQV